MIKELEEKNAELERFTYAVSHDLKSPLIVLLSGRWGPIFFVQDNGVGIDPNHHERVFGLFNKLDAQSEAAGAGLALVKRVIEVHGGHIWVELDGVGLGAMFLFTLPHRPAVSTREPS